MKKRVYVNISTTLQHDFCGADGKGTQHNHKEITVHDATRNHIEEALI